MQQSAKPTQFALAERLSSEEIQTQSAFFSSLPYLRELADALPTIFVVLNTYRQIVFANQALADFAGKKRPEELYGLRPGEAFHCIHSNEDRRGMRDYGILQDMRCSPRHSCRHRREKGCARMQDYNPRWTIAGPEGHWPAP